MLGAHKIRLSKGLNWSILKVAKFEFFLQKSVKWTFGPLNVTKNSRNVLYNTGQKVQIEAGSGHLKVTKFSENANFNVWNCQARVQTMSRSCPGHDQVMFRSCTGHLNTISISNLKVWTWSWFYNCNAITAPPRKLFWLKYHRFLSRKWN